MITHIDNLGSFLDALESRFQHGFGFSDEGGDTFGDPLCGFTWKCRQDGRFKKGGRRIGKE